MAKKFCPVNTEIEYCLEARCAWWLQSNYGPEEHPWGECSVLEIAQRLKDIACYDEDDLGLVHVRIRPNKGVQPTAELAGLEGFVDKSEEERQPAAADA